MKMSVTEAGRLPSAPATPQTVAKRAIERMRSVLRALARPIGRLSTARRDEEALRTLSDRELKDIGLDRSEIGSIVHMSANDGGRIRRRSA